MRKRFVLITVGTLVILTAIWLLTKYLASPERFLKISLVLFGYLIGYFSAWFYVWYFHLRKQK